MIGFEEYDPCPETFYTEYTSRQCEHEINHEGSHVYTVWHSESVWYGDRFYSEAVPDGPVYWDTELRCPESIHCGTFPVHPTCPDLALADLMIHIVNVHDIDPMTALDSIQNEITAWKVVPA
jgi:hypothetical protein